VKAEILFTRHREGELESVDDDSFYEETINDRFSLLPICPSLCRDLNCWVRDCELVFHTFDDGTRTCRMEIEERGTSLGDHYFGWW